MSEDDDTTTLDELERKLRNLEAELEGTPLRPAAAPAPVPVPPVPGPVVTAPAPAPRVTFEAAPVPATDARLAELLRCRQELERSALELLADFERVLTSLRATTDAVMDARTAAPGGSTGR